MPDTRVENSENTFSHKGLDILRPAEKRNMKNGLIVLKKTKTKRMSGMYLIIINALTFGKRSHLNLRAQ